METKSKLSFYFRFFVTLIGLSLTFIFPLYKKHVLKLEINNRSTDMLFIFFGLPLFVGGLLSFIPKSQIPKESFFVTRLFGIILVFSSLFNFIKISLLLNKFSDFLDVFVIFYLSISLFALILGIFFINKTGKNKIN